METCDMFAVAIKKYPTIKWAYRHNNDLVSEQHPIIIDGLWYPGRLSVRFTLWGDIMDTDYYCHDASRPFSTEEACQKSIDDMPF